MQVSRGGDLLGTLEPEKRFYKASRQGTSEVGVRPRLNEDVYLNFGGMSDDGSRAVIQAYVFPLVSWIWIGGLVLIGGTLVCLVPSKIKMQYARTEVVGITQKICGSSEVVVAVLSQLPGSSFRLRPWPKPRRRSPAWMCAASARTSAASAAARIPWPPAPCWNAAFRSLPRSSIANYRRWASTDKTIIDQFVAEFGPCGLSRQSQRLRLDRSLS